MFLQVHSIFNKDSFKTVKAKSTFSQYSIEYENFYTEQVGDLWKMMEGIFHLLYFCCFEVSQAGFIPES